MITTAEINELIVKTDNHEVRWVNDITAFKCGQWRLFIASRGTRFLSRTEHEGPDGRLEANSWLGLLPRARAVNRLVRSINRQFEGKGKRT